MVGFKRSSLLLTMFLSGGFGELMACLRCSVSIASPVCVCGGEEGGTWCWYSAFESEERNVKRSACVADKTLSFAPGFDSPFMASFKKNDP